MKPVRRAHACRLALALVVASLSGGCLPTTIDKLQAFDPKELIFSQGQGMLTESIAISCRLGERFGAALLVLLCLHCGIKAMRADVNLWSVAKEYVIGALVMLALLGTCRLGQNSPFWIVTQLGDELGKLYQPPDSLLIGSLKQSQLSTVNCILKFLAAVKDANAEGAEATARDALAHVLSSVPTTATLILNGAAMHVIRIMAKAAYAWMLAFYLIIGPAVVPLLALPQTRPVFMGWFKGFLSINLWPCFFAIADRVGLVMIENSPLVRVIGVSSEDAIATLVNGHAVLLACNLTFMLVYLGIPVAAYGLVAGLSRPFRGIV